MKTLFEVGEQVILQSKKQPESNGEYTVAEIIMHGCPYFCRVNEEVYVFLGGGYGYILDDVIAYDKEGGNEVVWNETALRKKHKPSELSFNEMMNTFKITEKM